MAIHTSSYSFGLLHDKVRWSERHEWRDLTFHWLICVRADFCHAKTLRSMTTKIMTNSLRYPIWAIIAMEAQADWRLIIVRWTVSSVGIVPLSGAGLLNAYSEAFVQVCWAIPGLGVLRSVSRLESSTDLQELVPPICWGPLNCNVCLRNHRKCAVRPGHSAADLSLEWSRCFSSLASGVFRHSFPRCHHLLTGGLSKVLLLVLMPDIAAFTPRERRMDDHP